MKKQFKNTVLSEMERTRTQQAEILTETDLQLLPLLVQKYLRIVGVLGREKVRNFRAEFRGGIRSKQGDPFMKLHSVQYNFTDLPSRIFYITARKAGIPAFGLHLYKDETAFMKIKILGLFKVADARGPEMNQGETVTFFNDLCFMAPAALIDRRIEWKEIDALSVSAKFTNGKISIRATLFFNDRGELIDFISNDRFETADGKTYLNYPWRTPVTRYAEIGGYHLPAAAQLIYQHPDGDFCYGEFELAGIGYNVTE